MDGSDLTKALIREPAEAYHARRKEFLSSHGLADFRRCPQLFRQKRLGLVLDEDRPAYLLGRALHTLALEGRQKFEAEYAVGGPINPKTGQRFGSATKAFAEWAEQQGKPVLTDDQAVLIENMAASIRGHERAAALLQEGLAEGVVRTRHCGHDCQIRLDWLPADFRGRGFVDLKSCDDLDWFEADARRYGYVHQLAFYRSVLWQVCGHRLPVHLIASEKKPPYRCGLWLVGQDVLAIAQQDNEQAMQRLTQCLERDHWPTGYEEPRVFDHL